MLRPPRSPSPPRGVLMPASLHPARRPAALVLALVLTLAVSLVLAMGLTLVEVPASHSDDDARTLNDTMLVGRSRRDPAAAGGGQLDGLQYPDPTSGLVEMK